jgi:hypothetical protein
MAASRRQFRSSTGTVLEPAAEDGWRYGASRSLRQWSTFCFRSPQQGDYADQVNPAHGDRH